jgi:hypothetical protein
MGRVALWLLDARTGDDRFDGGWTTSSNAHIAITPYGVHSIRRRNRHYPKCQLLARAQWLDDRRADLLPIPYFHVVFTVPEEIAAIV